MSGDTVKINRDGGPVSVEIRAGHRQKTFWSVSVRHPTAAGGFTPYTERGRFSPSTGGSANAVVPIGDASELDGAELKVIFVITRLQLAHADQYALKAIVEVADGSAEGGRLTVTGTVDQPSIIQDLIATIELR